MELKEFLKPTLSKIIIFIIIFLVIVPLIKPHPLLCKPESTCPEPALESILTQFLISRSSAAGINYINLFLGLASSYIVSCLIIFIYKKIKIKK